MCGYCIRDDRSESRFKEFALNVDPPAPPKTAFLTGATSAVGIRVVERLSRDGWDLCCLLRDASAERALFNFGATSVVRGSCEAPSSWEHAIEGIPTILHLAPVTVAQGPVEAAVKYGAERFISLSSTRGFSKLPDALADSVREGEAHISRSSLNYTILQSSMIYGSGDDANIDRVATWLDSHRWAPLVDGGRARIQPIHIDDVVEAIALAIARPEPTRRTKLILAGREALSWGDMIRTLAAIKKISLREVPVPGAATLFLARRLSPLLPRLASISGIIERMREDRTFDIAATREALGGWTPTTFLEGAERTYLKSV